MKKLNMQIVVVKADRQGVKDVTVELAAGATVADAIAAAGWSLGEKYVAAVWNHRVEDNYVLQEGDRVELLAPLTVDPMTARRLREEKKASTNPLAAGRNGSKHRLY